jgi:hypothetical protein
MRISREQPTRKNETGAEHIARMDDDDTADVLFVDVCSCFGGGRSHYASERSEEEER